MQLAWFSVRSVEVGGSGVVVVEFQVDGLVAECQAEDLEAEFAGELGEEGAVGAAVAVE